MATEKPLNVRCAEAMGWTKSRLAPLGHKPGPEAWRSPDGKIEGAYLPPYGDDTPEGWACTGPLIGRFELSVTRNSLDDLYYVSPPKMRCFGVAVRACAAVAEWVAEYVEGGKVKP